MRLGKSALCGDRERQNESEESMRVMRHELCVCVSVCVRNELDMGESHLGLTADIR